MTDKIADHLLHKMTMTPCIVRTGMVKTAIASLLSISILAQSVYASEQEWWFDVEVILFKRNVDVATISEKFKQSRLDQPPSDQLDLLTPYLNPDLSYLRAGLPYCRASNLLAVQKQYEQDFAFPMPVIETIKLSSQPMEEQEQQTAQDLAVNVAETAEEMFDDVPAAITAETTEDRTQESFQYEVSTTDIFAQSDDTISLAQTTDTDGVNLANSEQNNSGNIDQQTNIALAPDVYVPTPPIKVEFIEWQMPREFLCSYAEQIDASFASTSMTSLQDNVSDNQPSKRIKRVPEIINGIEWQQKRGAFLLPTSTTHMADLYNKIKRQRDITPILHLNWRQKVNFGRDKGQTFRLFAGENFAQQFDVNGLPLMGDTDSVFDHLNPPSDEFYIPEQERAGLTPEQQTLITSITGTDSEVLTEDLFARIDSALTDGTPFNIDQVGIPVDVQKNQQTNNGDPAELKELWQLDGGITVYLRNIGRVPYLHIDSNLDFRQAIFDPTKTTSKKGFPDDLSEQGTVAINPMLQLSTEQLSTEQPNTEQPDYLQPNFLHSVNFNQLRRVISKQVHYFDHPLFGMVVRINRHKWPEVPKDEDEDENENEVEASSQDN